MSGRAHIPPHSPPAAARRQGGFSIVELMVAMAIGLFLIAGAGYVFVGSKTSYNTLEGLSRIQENARYAFEYMGEDIRMAGFSGGPEGSCTNVVPDPGTNWDANLKEPCTPSTATPPLDGPLVGYDEGSPPPGLAPLRGDAITVVHADADEEYNLSNYDEPTKTFTLTFASCPTSGLPAVGEIFVAADYTHAAVFRITAVSACSGGTMTLTHSGDLGPFGGDIGARKLYPLRAATYYIDTNPAGEPALWRRELGASGGATGTTAMEVIEGVEDMDIQYGEDTVVEVPDEIDEVTVYRATAAAVTDWTRVLSVRITLTLVTRSGTSLVPSGDGLLRKTFTHTIAVRNRLQ